MGQYTSKDFIQLSKQKNLSNQEIKLREEFIKNMKYFWYKLRNILDF